MIKINLLPIRQQRKLEAARREASLLATIAVLVVLACLGAWGLSKWRLDAVVAENGRLNKEIRQLEEQVKEVDAMDEAKQELQRKLDVIADLRDKKSGPVHMLDELAIAAPERVVLTSLKQKGDTLEITGISVSNEVISQFLRNLDASDYFDTVYLKNIEALAKQKQTTVNVVLKQFQLTARLVTPKSKEELAEESKKGQAKQDGKDAKGNDKAGDKATDGAKDSKAPATAPKQDGDGA